MSQRLHASIIALVETVADSVAGYEHIASHTHGFGWYSYCEMHALERQRLAVTLRRAIEAHGGHADSQGTILGSAHRLFLDLKSALLDSEQSVVEELLRGERFLADQIRKAHRDAGALPTDIEEILVTLYRNVQSSLGELAALRKRIERGPQPTPSQL